MTIDEMLEALVKHGKAWMLAQSAAFRPTALPLSAAARAWFSSFFETETLGTVRLAHTPRIENPEFYAEVIGPGQPPPIDFSQANGITFVDTVVFSDTGWPPSESLIFHELVHVVQYRLLGVDQFVRRYVYGWAENGFQYATIPLEVDAYKLQAVFEASPSTAFSVEQAVRARAAVY